MCADGVLAGAIEDLDAQVLFAPFEEQFDLPTAMIQLSDCQSGDDKVVGQEDQRLAGLEVAIADAAQRGGIIAAGIETGRGYSLVETQSGGFVHRAGIAADETGIFLGACDEKGGAQVQPVKPGEVQIAAIHDIERTRIPDHLIKNIYIMNIARGDNDDGGKVPLEREQGVQFDGGLAASECGPGKQGKAQLNGGRIQRVGGALEIAHKGITRVELRCLPDEDLGEVSEDAPVTVFVGVGQGAAGGGLADAGMIELWAEGNEAGFDVPQTLTPGQLRKGQDEKLFVGWKFADSKVAPVARDTLVELVLWQEIHELGENGSAFVHKVENRLIAANHPRKTPAELKSKKILTAGNQQFYRNKTIVSENLTGQ